MENKQRLFIYDRREIVVLLFLGVLVAVFAFTLGIHLGKRIESPSVTSAAPSVVDPHAVVEAAPDVLPQKQDFQEQAKAAGKVADEALNQSLHDEVARTGIKLEAQRQVDLPLKTKAEQKKPVEVRETSHEEQDQSLAGLEAVRRLLPLGDFTLEVGSTPAFQDAKDQVEAFEALGLKPVLRQSKSSGKERRFRIYLGGFTSQEDAAAAGEKYQNQHVIDSFVVTRSQIME